ncbi:MAG: 1-deoxy-D-xylulose-5-phosphate synthase [Bacteroidales bacterium]|jgi:1-deoxy-D-xylulose-5-phosphate synthase|nr:1-deoxy-D-xylulose-5-phosphate synthase [Bacteroidales bacterium]
MEYQYLTHIDSPADLKKLPVSALPQVCAEVRDFIIRSCAKNPGHLASSLGAVEFTVALHYVMDTPHDRLVWDVGHQAYAHKILTGRRDRFCTNRQFGGLAPFPTPAESEYDTFTAGHASNSISAALGMAVADKSRRVVAIIGDGAMTGGLAYEGLNNTSMIPSNLLILLNDNNMAIDPIHGGFTQYLVDITTSGRYNHLRYFAYRALRKVGLMNDEKKGKLQRFNNNLKSILTKQSRNIFSGLNLRYFGPADGHDVIAIVKILSEIKDYTGPKVLHLITRKGYGYSPAEADQIVWHAPGKFDPDTGVRLEESHAKLWQHVFGETLLELAKEDERVVGITAAMPSGSSVNILQAEMPDRAFDVGIAEGHAVTFSAGLSKEGKIPFCAIYSSFLQRAYDNIIHDVALQNLHVIFAIDRAGIVGQDGATHHGLFDLCFLRSIPNMTVLAPMDGEELKQMLRWAKDAQGPVAIRYPRGGASPRRNGESGVRLEGSTSARLISSPIGLSPKAAILSIGAIGNTVHEAIEGLDIAHYDMRSVKPLDTDTLDYIAAHYKQIYTAEDGMLEGGFGSAVVEYFADKGYSNAIHRFGVPGQFVTHGKPDELYHMLGLDAEGIRSVLIKNLNV